MSNREVLVLQGIKQSYREVSGASLSILKNIDLNLKRGEMVALVSPSGTGKSTILHISGLLERPDEGNIIIDGQLCNELPDKQKASLRSSKIGFVYQYHHLLSDFSIIENIILPQIISGIDYAQAHHHAMNLLDRMEMAHYAKRRPADISGGEQQRVAICRAVANTPLLLLADEPTGNLDPATAVRVFDVLKDLVFHFGLAALIATHNHDLAARMDRQITIKDGVIADL
ncbi:ABC transporter ATP-binding protein [Candidatus Liberibacter sp.]|uniref:ABC transporter ATP-binding protein n=1 Tax=Candidatus Liberibacter sp. TaxID=34022 RepID=UPI0015F3F919|nr:ABC transporter ATP-binding protein [Candidatus Liberibacter sp.]MBA5724326.1 ABC transporter ATP-binding protein [Candidatus Liberibacter sp.]